MMKQVAPLRIPVPRVDLMTVPADTATDGMILDDSAWPVLYTSLGPDLTAERFMVFARWYEGQIARAEQEGVYVLTCSDARGTAPSREVQRTIADWQATLTDAQFNRCWLSTVVVDSVVVRGVLTAINWFRPPTTPQVVVANERDAFVAIADECQRRGRPPPAPPWWISGPQRPTG